jgi:O-antigen biosynthesis protein
MEQNTITSADYSSSFNEYVYNEIPGNTLCLDVGCWNGNLGKVLIEKKQCVVDGIDYRSDIIQKAKENGYQNVYTLNFNNDSVDLSALTKKYDVIICADVLEHLVNPQNVLKMLKSFLKPDGMFVISLPNVAFLQTRVNLLLGKWAYREFGTLDKTHLRFYTIASAQRMVEGAGFNILRVLPYNAFTLLKKLPRLTKLFPSVLAYQFILIAAPKYE